MEKQNEEHLLIKNKLSMKRNWIKNTLFLGLITTSTLSFAQKMNETNAAVAYKSYLTNVSDAEPDFEAAKKLLQKSKDAIDLAAEHPDTKESQKTLYYKGEIYASYFNLGIRMKDTNFVKNAGNDPLQTSIDALKLGYTKTGKNKSDIEDCARNNELITANFAAEKYNASNFAEAAKFYRYSYLFGDAIGIIDTMSIFNAAISFDKAGELEKALEMYQLAAKYNYRGALSYALCSSTFRKLKKYEDAKAIIIEGRKKYPMDKDLILESVNTYIELKDPAGAEASLNAAIANDPNNKILHYVIGTVYSDLKDYEKSEKALNKALEIDPNYADAQYQLGAVLVGWAGEIRKQANDLKPGDKRYDGMMKFADDIYKRALPPLEKYIEKFPNDKAVLDIMWKLYRSIGQPEKSAEFKKRAAAAK